MSRFLAFVATGTLISLSTIVSACTTNPDYTSSIGSSTSYQRDYSLNPACAGGFRPSDNRPCSY
ncbi:MULTISPECIES: hypothetical protein [Rhizobium]|uniref:Lipoprotein n=1 Tax=Rhizobium grahamii TaxID=1120045 RepID=A0A370KS57_9HYPH|nr:MULTISPECIES: hypothetical protein [Rhizobium]MBB3318943.1 Ca2+/Na+ antiporter [Rhizobium sp. BK181]RDJ13000.1 hypothetical protein B5K06_09590 [Rhizobium grahamii]